MAVALSGPMGGPQILKDAGSCAAEPAGRQASPSITRVGRLMGLTSTGGIVHLQRAPTGRAGYLAGLPIEITGPRAPGFRSPGIQRGLRIENSRAGQGYLAWAFSCGDMRLLTHTHTQLPASVLGREFATACNLRKVEEFEFRVSGPGPT